MRAPSVEQAVEALASQRGESIVPSGAAAANTLGLTTQVPVRSVYLTSGRTRTMNLGKHVIELPTCATLAARHGASTGR